MSDTGKGTDFWIEQQKILNKAIDLHQRTELIGKATINGQQKVIQFLCDHMKKNFQWTNEVEEQVEKLSLEMLDEISMHTGDSP